MNNEPGKQIVKDRYMEGFLSQFCRMGVERNKMAVFSIWGIQFSMFK
jgi:hypothetical protein